MKKYILPVILLAVLSGCGKVTDASGIESHIDIVSGTAVGTTKDTTTSETSTEDEGSTKATTTKTAGDKISGTTTTVNTTKKSSTRTVTRAAGGSSGGGVYGTTRAVPTVPRTTSAPDQHTTTTPTPIFDPKDYSSVEFEFDSKTPNKLDVSRMYSDGKIRPFQGLTVDTTEIQEKLEHDPAKSINDFITRTDLDFDGYPDLFIAEREDELNRSGRYFRYDPEKGTYIVWEELNAIRYEIKADEYSNKLEVLERIDDVDYEKKTYEWNSQKQLVLREYIHQYTTSEGDILIEYVNYDENGTETSRETRDGFGNLVDDNTNDPSFEEE